MDGDGINKKIIILFAGIISILIIVSFITGNFWLWNGWDTPSPPSAFIVEQDIENKTLTVISVKETGLSWENVELFEGSATLPNGTIEINDVITNCSGNVVLVWKITGIVIANFDFE